jgi:hypothetical protein
MQFFMLRTVGTVLNSTESEGLPPQPQSPSSHNIANLTRKQVSEPESATGQQNRTKLSKLSHPHPHHNNNDYARCHTVDDDAHTMSCSHLNKSCTQVKHQH